MQAITTKFIHATNTRGSRIKATCWRGNKTVSMPHELSGEDAHKFAAQELLKSFDATCHVDDVKWSKAALIACSTGDNSGYTFLIVQPYNVAEIENILATLKAK